MNEKFDFTKKTSAQLIHFDGYPILDQVISTTQSDLSMTKTVPRTERLPRNLALILPIALSPPFILVVTLLIVIVLKKTVFRPSKMYLDDNTSLVRF